MKNYICIIAMFLLIFVGCKNSPAPGSDENKNELSKTKSESVTENKVNLSKNTIKPGTLFTITDAEKILGERAHLSDSLMSNKDEALTYKSSYTANTLDKSTEKTGNIYFLFESFKMDTTAIRFYTSIKKANENHGIKVIHDMGDEAYFHSDNQNFYFIMVRKGGNLFRMKVNKITKTTSLDAFYEVAKNISSAM